jgi:hypothetical protein
VETRLAVPEVEYGSVSAGAAAGSTASVTPPPAASNGNAGYSAFTLEDHTRFAMAWTTFEDAFRKGFPHVAEYSAAITDAHEATR